MHGLAFLRKHVRLCNLGQDSTVDRRDGDLAHQLPWEVFPSKGERRGERFEALAFVGCEEIVCGRGRREVRERPNSVRASVWVHQTACCRRGVQLRSKRLDVSASHDLTEDFLITRKTALLSLPGALLVGAREGSWVSAIWTQELARIARLSHVLPTLRADFLLTEEWHARSLFASNAVVV